MTGIQDPRNVSFMQSNLSSLVKAFPIYIVSAHKYIDIINTQFNKNNSGINNDKTCIPWPYKLEERRYDKQIN